MAKSRDVSDIVFSIMVFGDFIAMVFMFFVIFYTIHFILVKYRPSLVYVKRRRSQDISMNLMARRMSKKFKDFYTKSPLDKKESLASEKRVSFGGVETDIAHETFVLGPVPKQKDGQREENVYEEIFV